VVRELVAAAAGNAEAWAMSPELAGRRQTPEALKAYNAR